MIDLLAEPDLDWVSDVVDIVERNAGRPWRAALEQLDDLERAAMCPASERASRGVRLDLRMPRRASGHELRARTIRQRFRAVVGAIQRLTGGRTRNARTARTARALVLGHPALDGGSRQARIDHAALMLGVSASDLETLMWSDLPRERPVELPTGRPLELEVAAFANVALLQRTMQRARSIVLAAPGDDVAPLVRAAADRGLLASSAIDRDGTVRLEITGPLSLVHRTSVYGRALGELVPLLGALREWALEVRIDLPLASFSTHVSSPVLLPAPPARLAAPPYPLARLCRALERSTRGQRSLVLTPTPPPLRVGRQLLWPDLAIDELAAGPRARRTYVELVGFWTPEYLERRLAAYRDADAHVLLCVDRGRAAGDRAMPSEVVTYTRQLPGDAVLARLLPPA
jgi:uncharacterized protein